MGMRLGARDGAELSLLSAHSASRKRGFTVKKIWMAVLIAASTAAIAQQQPVTRVQTALNHLTVIEVAEPIIMAAAGSEAFEIERHGTRVFVKPTKPDVATNLFVWTERGRSIYELQPAGAVSKMDVLVTSVQQPPTRAAAESLSKEDVAKVAERVLSQTLLNTQPVNAAGIKTQKNRVNVRLEDVVRGKDTIYVRYQVTKGEREFLDDKLLPLIAAAGRLDDLRIIDPSRPEISVRFNPFIATSGQYQEHVSFIFESFDLREDFFHGHHG
jgi:Conjugal transfer protein